MEIENLIAQARTYDLDRSLMFDLASVEAIRECWNGIGPEWLPKPLRELLTGHYSYFAAAALVHDWDFVCYPYRAKADFWFVNERLRKNCHALLAKGCPWYKRPLYRWRADSIADACQKFGWEAWQQASKG